MSEMFEQISKDERDMINYYIDRYVLDYEGNPKDDKANLRYILRIWEDKKSNLYEMFNKQLILSKDYEYKQSANELINELTEKTSWYPFVRALEFNLNNLCKNEKIRFEGNRCGLYNYFPCGFSSIECIANKLDFSCIFLYNGKKYAFPEGTKYMKFLGKLAEIADLKESFEKFRIEHSMVLNNAKQHGKLCLSIHPLDFMTMSDNDSGWSSCMSWDDNGCYRMGTVEMMNSPTVVVAYLSSANPMLINGREWDNKKWRQLFVVNEHVITAVKPYPYADTELTKACLAWLNELSGEQYSDEDFLFGDRENRYLNYYRLAAEANKMYNDFPSCNHLTKIKLPIPEKREGVVIRWRFNYSGPTQCMCCGRTDYETYFNDADTLLCDDCRDSTDWVYCEHCGCRIDPENDDYYVDDNGYYYCEDCRDNYFTYDDIVGEYIDNDDAIELYLSSTRDKKIDDVTDNSRNCLWTHSSIIDDENDDGELYVHQDNCGNYYVYLDEAPKRVLTAFAGAGNWSIKALRDMVNKESYKGYTMENVLYNWWNNEVEKRIPIVP